MRPTGVGDAAAGSVRREQLRPRQRRERRGERHDSVQRLSRCFQDSLDELLYRLKMSVLEEALLGFAHTLGWEMKPRSGSRRARAGGHRQQAVKGT